MNDSFNTILETTMKQMVDDKISIYGKKKSNFNAILLSSIDKNILSHRIEALPNDYVTILFLRYYFNMDVSTIRSLTGVEHVYGTLVYLKKMLSLSFDLPMGSLIHNSTFEQACKFAVNRHIHEAVMNKSHVVPNYSRKFKKALKMLRSAQKLNSPLGIVARTAAIFALVSFIGFGTTMAASAEAREWFKNWLVNTFPQFTQFASTETESVLEEFTEDMVDTYRPHYLPIGFKEFEKPALSPSTISYLYLNDNDDMISIYIAIPDGNFTGFDTEGGAVIEEIEYKDNTALSWQIDGFTYIMWSQDGLEMSVVAELDKNEAFIIADSIYYDTTRNK